MPDSLFVLEATAIPKKLLKEVLSWLTPKVRNASSAGKQKAHQDPRSELISFYCKRFCVRYADGPTPNDLDSGNLNIMKRNFILLLQTAPKCPRNGNAVNNKRRNPSQIEPTTYQILRSSGANDWANNSPVLSHLNFNSQKIT